MGAFGWVSPDARAVHMVNEVMVKPPGRPLAEAVSKRSCCCNLKRSPAVDPLQEQRGEHLWDK